MSTCCVGCATGRWTVAAVGGVVVKEVVAKQLLFWEQSVVVVMLVMLVVLVVVFTRSCALVVLSCCCTFCIALTPHNPHAHQSCKSFPGLATCIHFNCSQKKHPPLSGGSVSTCWNGMFCGDSKGKFVCTTEFGVIEKRNHILKCRSDDS